MNDHAKEVAVSDRAMKLWMSLMPLMVLLAVSCSGGGDAADTDGDESESRKCVLDEDCLSNEFCALDNTCQPIQDPTDGDGTPADEDGDDSETPDGDDCAFLQFPDIMDFGSVPIGESTSKEVILVNTGSCNLEIGDVQFIDPHDDFSLENPPTWPYVIEPGYSLTLKVVFVPTSGYAANVPMQIASSADNARLATVLLQSDYKGVTSLETSLDALEFGNVFVGDPGVTLGLNICNGLLKADGNKAVKVSGIYLKYSDTVAHFDLDMDDEPSSQNPIFINPEECITVEATYEPTTETIWPAIHENYLVIVNDADTTENDKTEIYMAGSADSDSLYIYPNPIDFGAVDIDTQRAIQLTIQNRTPRDLVVENVQLGGQHCEEFTLYLGDYATPFTLLKDETINQIGIGYEPTNTGLDTGCVFTIQTDQQGAANTVQVNITGQGREPNLPPVAKVARYDNGPDIILPIDVAPGDNTRVTLYGDISNDPDGNYPLTYYWQLFKPGESNAGLDTNGAGIATFVVDWPGSVYTVELVVEDTEGAQSQAKTVQVRFGANEMITIDMQFSGDDEMNVDLIWLAPNGIPCSDNDMNSHRSCDMGAFGVSRVSNHTTRYAEGNRETITHESATDGSYKIQVRMTEDCSFRDPVLGICWSHDSSTATVKIILNQDTEPSWTKTATLGGVGEFFEWTINKVGGEWNAPTP